MFSTTTGSRPCEAISRRALLRLGSLSLFGLSLPRRFEATARAAAPRQDVRCILLWTEGGMSNIDTLDMKPDAPVEFRGEFRPIASNVPGVPVSEHLPWMSQQMDKVCQVRSVVHSGSQHTEACHLMHAGYPQFPGVSAELEGPRADPCMGWASAGEKVWRRRMSPRLPLSGGRMLDELDAWQRVAESAAVLGMAAERRASFSQAYDLMTSPAAKRAFRIDEEPETLRRRYGLNRVGQSALLARRLIEAGVGFVTVESSGWDTHSNNFKRLKNDLLPPLDRAWSALLVDLEERGLLDHTLVICAGDFGRTPKVNGAAGRDHFPRCNTISLSGAGVAMGHVVGQTDARCENVVGKQHSTLDYAATIFRLLGIDNHQKSITDNGCLVTFAGGEPIADVFA